MSTTTRSRLCLSIALIAVIIIQPLLYSISIYSIPFAAETSNLEYHGPIRHPTGIYAYIPQNLVINRTEYVLLIDKSLEVLYWLEAHLEENAEAVKKPGAYYTMYSSLLNKSWIYYCSQPSLNDRDWLLYYILSGALLIKVTSVDIQPSYQKTLPDDVSSAINYNIRLWRNSIKENYWAFPLPSALREDVIPIIVPAYVGHANLSNVNLEKFIRSYIDSSNILILSPVDNIIPQLDLHKVVLDNIIISLEKLRNAVINGDSGLFTFNYISLVLSAFPVIYCDSYEYFGLYNTVAASVTVATGINDSISDILSSVDYYFENLAGASTVTLRSHHITYYIPLVYSRTEAVSFDSGLRVTGSKIISAKIALLNALLDVLYYVPLDNSLTYFASAPSFLGPAASYGILTPPGGLSEVGANVSLGAGSSTSTSSGAPRIERVPLNRSDIESLSEVLGDLVNPSQNMGDTESSGASSSEIGISLPRNPLNMSINYPSDKSIRSLYSPSNILSAIPWLIQRLAGVSAILPYAIFAAIVAALGYLVATRVKINELLSSILLRLYLLRSRLGSEYMKRHEMKSIEAIARECYILALNLSGPVAGRKDDAETPREYLLRVSPSLPGRIKLFLAASTKLYELVRYGKRRPPEDLLGICLGARP